MCNRGPEQGRRLTMGDGKAAGGVGRKNGLGVEKQGWPRVTSGGQAPGEEPR